LPWFHNCVLLDKVKGTEERLWYIQQATQHGWSRNVLVLQIESRLYHRQGKALTNFQQTLPAPQPDLAGQLLKDPYNFDFLTLSSEAHERDLERGLLEHLRQFLLELGVGFAFVGSQYPLEVGGEDFKLGIILCKTRNKVLVEYALRGSNRPIGVPEFRLAEALPDHLKGTLPTVEELEAELAKGTTIDGQTSSE
jgi:predicted nuclease of restriction endonuclease-like (RecB) superfamily